MKSLSVKALAAAVVIAASQFALDPALAAGGPSGARVNFPVQGHIGEVVVNPYKIAPLTAVIRNGGYVLTDVTVKVLPKPNGRTIEYKVSDRQLKTHSGVPVFGLYPDWMNTVEVSYTRHFNGKAEKFTDTYRFYTSPIYTRSTGLENQVKPFDVKVQHVDEDFKDRLYFVGSQLVTPLPIAMRYVWNNPSGGSLEWAFNNNIGIVDTAGDLRWWLMDTLLEDPEDPLRSGYFMGFQQTKDGALTWGFGQRYVKYDLLGREIFNRRLPAGYADYSHAFDNAQNGHSFLRVSYADYRRPDGKRVHTVRDVIVELDADGGAVDDWRLMDILDPYRDNVLKTLDQGAVCLNVDPSKAGQTLSTEQLAEQDKHEAFGDITGVGAGRNWAHVNSVDYDPSDDSIIISSRHQSAIIKIGRDKKVKWILASPEGWKKGWAEKVLTPVDKSGKPVKCEGSVCEGGFDWTWTQHTAWRIDEKSDKDVIYITAFDNGDGRGMDQPALADDKYTRGVVYKIDQKKMTVEQVWEVGKKEGHDYYSPTTGLTRYEADKNSVTVFFSTAGFDYKGVEGGDLSKLPHPYLNEYRWGETTPAVSLKFHGICGYQAFPISIEKAFTLN